MGFDDVYKTPAKVAPIAPPATGRAASERNVVFTADEEGMLTRLQAVEQMAAQLQTEINAIRSERATQSADLVPGPVDVTTLYETASDGTLRAAVQVNTAGDGIMEFALFPAPASCTTTKDSYVCESATTTNYDGSDLVVGNLASEGIKRALVDITHDIYPDGFWDQPSICLLRLAVHGTPDGQRLKCYAVTASATTWEEATVTWDTQPEMETDLIDSIMVTDDDADSYVYFDLRNYFDRRTAHAQASATTTINGFVITADEDEDEAEVSFYSKETAPTLAKQPQLLYWTSPETSKTAGIGTKESRLYSKAGGEYWFMYRSFDAFNNGSGWSRPVSIILPSQGATPDAPLHQPTVFFTQLGSVVSVELDRYEDFQVPSDLDHFEIRCRIGSGGEEIFKTDNRRTLLRLPISMPQQAESFYISYRLVTRSGVTSDWSDENSIAVGADGVAYHYAAYTQIGALTQAHIIFNDSAITLTPAALEGYAPKESIQANVEGSDHRILTDYDLPPGIICMWHGTILSIPAGWALCDGSGGTPDLRAKFVRGAPAGSNPGTTGGSDTVALTEAQLATHDHSIGGNTGPEAAHTHGAGTLAVPSGGAHTHTTGTESANHSHQYYANNDAAPGSGRWSIASLPGTAISTTGESATHTHSIASSGAHTHTVSGSTGAGSSHLHSLPANTGNAGSGTAHENRPAYYEVAFIMKL